MHEKVVFANLSSDLHLVKRNYIVIKFMEYRNPKITNIHKSYIIAKFYLIQNLCLYKKQKIR